jgi:acyl-CoA reductase-like NAD-dependent aldehyde dehydrogenase
MLEIPLWYGGRSQTSLDHRTLLDVRGEPLARVHQVPAIRVQIVAQALRAAAAPLDEDPAQRWAAIARAGELLLTASPGGIDAAEHARLVSRSTGAPIRASIAGVAELAGGMRGMAGAMRWQAPGGDIEAFRTRRTTGPDGRRVAWVPVGRVLGVIESSNHPAVQVGWLQALAMGWSVLVRPGSDDPITPWRVFSALVDAGFPADRLAFLSGGHDLVQAFLRASDRMIAYGGDAARNVLGADRRVLFNGPGRSKIFVDGDRAVADDAMLDFLFDGVSHAGGRKCLCTSAIMTRGLEGAGPMLDELGRRIAAMPFLDPLDPEAVLPAWKNPTARPPAPAELVASGGFHFVRPTLIRCAPPYGAPFAMELPTVWATSAELAADFDPRAMLHDTLALTLITGDTALVEDCLLEPTIYKVFNGRVPTYYSVIGAPYAGRLSDFLFMSKAAWTEMAPGSARPAPAA